MCVFVCMCSSGGSRDQKHSSTEGIEGGEDVIFPSY